MQHYAYTQAISLTCIVPELDTGISYPMYSNHWTLKIHRHLWDNLSPIWEPVLS